MSQNNDSILKALAKIIGESASDIKTAYEKRQEKRTLEIANTEKAKRIQLAEWAYNHFCIEANEVFNTAANVINGIKMTQPYEIKLAFNGKNFIDGVTMFEYQLPKVQGNNDNELHIRTLQATFNTISIDRFRQGYSSLSIPFECEVKDGFNKYTVLIGTLENEEQKIMPLNCEPGNYVGEFRYNNIDNRYYINSRQCHTLKIGTEFQMLSDDWIWLDAKIKANGNIHIASLGGYIAQAKIGCCSRIVPKRI